MGFVNDLIAGLLSGGWAAAIIKIIVLLAIICFLFMVVTNSFYWVPRQHQAVYDFAGKYRRTVGPGLHTRFPFLSTVTKVSMKVQLLTFTLDGLPFGTVQLGVRYHIISGYERNSVDELEQPLEQIKRAALNAAAARLLGKTFQEALSLRESVATAVKDALAAFSDNGYEVVEAFIGDITPNRQIREELELAEAAAMSGARQHAAAEDTATLVGIAAKAEANRLEIQTAAQIAAMQEQKTLVDALSATWEVDVETVLAFHLGQQYIETVRVVTGKGATLVVYPPNMPDVPPVAAPGTQPGPAAVTASTTNTK